MINKNLVVDIKTSIKVAMIKLSKSAKKCLMVLNDQKQLIGTLTDGDITVASGHGISFAATSDGSSASNVAEVFDDYETGTFTPAMEPASCNAARTTLVGSTIPAFTISVYLPS